MSSISSIDSRLMLKYDAASKSTEVHMEAAIIRITLHKEKNTYKSWNGRNCYMAKKIELITWINTTIGKTRLYDS